MSLWRKKTLAGIESKWKHQNHTGQEYKLATPAPGPVQRFTSATNSSKCIRQAIVSQLQISVYYNSNDNDNNRVVLRTTEVLKCKNYVMCFECMNVSQEPQGISSLSSSQLSVHFALKLKHEGNCYPNPFSPTGQNLKQREHNARRVQEKEEERRKSVGKDQINRSSVLSWIK